MIQIMMLVRTWNDERHRYDPPAVEHDSVVGRRESPQVVEGVLFVLKEEEFTQTSLDFSRLKLKIFLLAMHGGNSICIKNRKKIHLETPVLFSGYM